MNSKIRAFATALLTAASACLAQVNPTWQLHRPSMGGIPGDYVQAIYVDDTDRPYIAAYTPFWEEGGLGHFDGDRWTTLNNVDSPLVASPRFMEILRGPDGWIWIASDKGLLHYNPAVGPATLQRFDRTNTPMPGDQIRDIDFAPDGTLWIAVNNVSGFPAGGLVRFNPATNQWTVYTTANGITWGGGGWTGWDAIENVAVVPDATGAGYTVWFGSPDSLGMGSWRAGVFTWHGNPQTPPAGRYPIKVMTVDPVDDDGNIWLLTNQGLARRSRDGVYTPISYPAGVSSQLQKFQPLRNGRAIIGTFYADVFLFDGATWQFIGNWGGGTHTYALAEDSLGHIWAGGIGGASYYNGATWQRYRLSNTGMLSYHIQTIDFAPDGRVFLNGNGGPGVGGFNIFDGVHWTGVNNHNYGLGPVWGMPTDDVSSLSMRPNGQLLVAPSGQGLFDWDGATYTNLVPLGTSLSIVESDGIGRAWAAGSYGGLFHDNGSGQLIQTPRPAINTIKRDPLSTTRVWVCDWDTFTRTDGTVSNSWPRSLLGLTQNTLSEQLQSLAPALDGTVWIGSGSGLYHFNPVTSAYTRYTTANSGLPSTQIYRVHVAPDGSLWAFSQDDVPPYTGGLTHYDGTTWTTYTAANSPLRENNVACLASRPVTGGYELWVGMQGQGVAVLTFASACYANCDNSTAAPLLTANDFQCFLNKYASGDAAANCDGSTNAPVLNANDFQCFLNKYAAGCP